MNPPTRLTGLIVLAAAAALGAQAPAPRTPTFKVEVNYVEVDALVTDQQGTFVRNLRKEDFQVLEDGKPQTISAFSIVDIPIERAEKPLTAKEPIEPDVRSNARPFDGRVYVMVIDDFHTLFGRTDRVRRAAHQFVERHFSINDLMAVVHTAGATDSSQEFTNNKRLLLAAIDKTSGRKVRSATLGRTEEYYNTRDLRQAGERVNDPDDAERGFNAHSTLSTLRQVADWFSSVRGRRKAILFVSEGIDYDIADVFNNRSASTVIDDTRDVISAAARSNVAIYGIDPRGLTSLGDENITVGNFPDDTSTGIGSSSLQNEIRLSQDSLRTLSDETGGFAVVNRNQFSTAYDRIVRDNSSYYVLAYYPPSDKRDGKFHKIDVRVSRPGVAVSARRGYASPRGKPAAPPTTSNSPIPPDLRDAVNSPLPVSGLTFAAFAAPFKGAAPNASVLIGAELRGRDLKLAPSDKVTVTYYAVDSQGKVHPGNTDTITMNLRPDTKARVEQNGFRVLNRMDLPPGRYQLRVGATDSGGGTVGSIIYDLEVPDFAKSPIGMSGIVLTSASASAMPTARPDDQLRPVLPGPPAAARLFPPADEVVIFAEVYDNEADKLHKLDITATVTSDTGTVIWKNEEEHSSAEIQGKRGGFGYTARIPMRDLQPGLYVLKVEARSRLGASPSASRELQFSAGAPGSAPSR